MDPLTVARSPLPVAVPLTRYQAAWVNDRSRFKIATKSRRIGFSFATALEIALDVVARRSPWLTVSRTQETAKEFVREIKRHFEAMRMVAEASAEIEEVPTDLFFRDMRLSMFRLELPNGSVVQALSAHPDAARGFGGNVFLDEFGFHDQSEELWRGASASTMRGHRLLVVSTPNYQQGKYFDLARKCELIHGSAPERKQGIWSAHWVDIHEAAPQLAETGVPIDLEELRALADDEETWQQEYCCAFLSASEMWLSLELIAQARSAMATAEWDPERPVEGLLYAGMDIGRRRDITGIWIDEVMPNGLAIARGILPLRNMPFHEQLAIASAICAHPKMRRMCVDETGIGMMLAEELKRKHGYKVEPVTFNLATKEEMAVLARKRFEERLERIPENHPEAERALAAIKRLPTASGALRFDAERTEHGHADLAWSKFLACYAHGRPAGCGMPEFRTTGVLRPSAQASGW